MKSIVIRLILIIYCLLILLSVPIQPASIIALFLAISLAALDYAISKDWFTGITAGIYLFFCLLFPEFMFFLPIIIFEVSFLNMNIAVIFYIAGGFLLFMQNTALPISYLLIGCVFSVLLSYILRQAQSFENLYHKTRDDSTELNLALQEKNRFLTESQDAKMYAATLKERNRIAREIHDNVGHMLSRSILMVGALKAVNHDPSLNSPLAQLDETLSAAMTSIRESVHDLHEDATDLKVSIRSLTQDFTFCEIDLDYDIGPEIPKDIKYCFLSITKEALANIIKHSNATKVHLVLREYPSMFQLIIRDNGTKKEKKALFTNNGIGLTNMQERVAFLHGTIQIQDKIGFSIFITIPKGE